MTSTPAELSGTVSRITYQHPETHFTVLRLATDLGEVTVVGTFPTVVPGALLHLTGEWTVHPRYGRQFQAHSLREAVPITPEGLARYLGSGLIKGIGPALARRLVDHFGAATLAVIESQPERLAEVPGLGAQRRQRLVEGVAAHRAVQEIMLFLHGLGVTSRMAARIYKRYGAAAIEKIKSNPYRLADDVWGIGFHTADQLAAQMGIARDAPERARAAVLYQLSQAVGEGHMCLPLAVLSDQLSRNYGIAASLAEASVRELAASGRLVLEEAGGEWLVYQPRLHLAEREVARLLLQLAAAAQPLVTALELPGTADQPEVGDGIRLSAEQAAAVERAAAGGVVVITGGPGTGKTTIIRSIVVRAVAAHRAVLLAAPTGRAAKRMQEATGYQAKTIHRLLEFSVNEADGGAVFKRNADHPLDADLVIIDEVSMLDVPLAYHLLQAIRPGTGLVLVGDADQLPPVGPGSFLGACIKAHCVPVVRLTTVYRQAAESLIVTNAHRINRGDEPVYNRNGSDFYLVEETASDKLAERVTELVAERLPRFLACDPREDIQVLTPVRRGPAGVDALNLALQRALNPLAAGVDDDSLRLLPGDRVMQVRNDYTKAVFNGDIGRVVAVDEETGDVRVMFPDRDEGPEVTYEPDELDQLTLAYAASVHKSQGSEFPVVVLPLSRVMPALMSRNLLYTAVTRAKRFLVIVGEQRVVSLYIRNNTAHRRYGRLTERLANAASFGTGCAGNTW